MIETQRRMDEVWPARRLEVYGPASVEITAAFDREIEDAYVAWGPGLPLSHCAVVPCRCVEELKPEISAMWQRIFDRAEAAGAAWLAEYEASLAQDKGRRVRA